MKYYKIFFLVILSVLLPLALFAQTPPINHVGYLTGVTGIIIAVRNLVEILTMIVVGLAILVFFWGLVIYIKMQVIHLKPVRANQ